MSSFKPSLSILYEDNHLIAINKQAGEIVQGDKTGDTPLSEKVKEYIRLKYNKLGEAFIGVIHRLDRPVSGIVIFAKTSKALTRMNELFKTKQLSKKYWAIVENLPEKREDALVHYLVKNEKQNKSYVTTESNKNAKKAELHYKHLSSSDNYHLLEVELKTGRHHQIRVQLSAVGSVIKGDLKYGAKRSNSDASISLHSRKLEFIHPVKKEKISIIAQVPDDSLWKYFEKQINS